MSDSGDNFEQFSLERNFIHFAEQLGVEGEQFGSIVEGARSIIKAQGKSRGVTFVLDHTATSIVHALENLHAQNILTVTLEGSSSLPSSQNINLPNVSEGLLSVTLAMRYFGENEVSVLVLQSNTTKKWKQKLTQVGPIPHNLDMPDIVESICASITNGSGITVFPHTTMAPSKKNELLGSWSTIGANIVHNMSTSTFLDKHDLDKAANTAFPGTLAEG